MPTRNVSVTTAAWLEGAKAVAGELLGWRSAWRRSPLSALVCPADLIGYYDRLAGREESQRQLAGGPCARNGRRATFQAAFRCARATVRSTPTSSTGREAPSVARRPRGQRGPGSRLRRLPDRRLSLQSRYS